MTQSRSTTIYLLNSTLHGGKFLYWSNLLEESDTNADDFPWRMGAKHDFWFIAFVQRTLQETRARICCCCEDTGCLRPASLRCQGWCNWKRRNIKATRNPGISNSVLLQVRLCFDDSLLLFSWKIFQNGFRLIQTIYIAKEPNKTTQVAETRTVSFSGSIRRRDQLLKKSIVARWKRRLSWVNSTSNILESFLENCLMPIWEQLRTQSFLRSSSSTTPMMSPVVRSSD